jgi:hypothetical protein
LATEIEFWDQTVVIEIKNDQHESVKEEIPLGEARPAGGGRSLFKNMQFWINL